MKRYIAFCFIAIWFASCADNKPAAEIPAIDIETNLFNMEEIPLDILSDKIEYISKDILQILQKISPHFFISIVDKEYLSYTKLFDTLFDNVENKGAMPHTYQFRPFRIMLLNNLCYITPYKLLFYYSQTFLHFF